MPVTQNRHWGLDYRHKIKLSFSSNYLVSMQHSNSALFLKKEVSQFLKFWTCIYCVHQFFALFQMHIVSDLYFEVYKIVGE